MKEFAFGDTIELAFVDGVIRKCVVLARQYGDTYIIGFEVTEIARYHFNYNWQEVDAFFLERSIQKAVEIKEKEHVKNI